MTIHTKNRNKEEAPSNWSKVMSRAKECGVGHDN